MALSIVPDEDSPFPLSDAPQGEDSPFPLVEKFVDETPLVKKGWELLTGQRPLLKTGQSDYTTLKDVWDKTTWETITGYATQAPAGSPYDVRPALGIKSETPPVPEALAGPEYTPEAKKDLADNARLGLELFAGLLASGALPPGSIPSAVALMRSGPFMGMLRNVGPEFVRKTLIAAAPAAVDVATGAPEKALETFGYNLAGEYIGGGTGRAVSNVGQRLDRARQSVFGATDDAAKHSRVIRGLGEEPTLGIASGKHIPQAMDTAGAQSMYTGAVRDRHSAVLGTLDDELKRIQAEHPGGRVTAERDRIARRVGGLGDETLLDAVPQEVRQQLDTLPPKLNADLRMGYQQLDADYFSRPVPWTLSGRRQRPWGMDDMLLDPTLQATHNVGSDSIFGQTMRLMENLEAMGPTVALDTAMDLHRTVDGFMREAFELTTGNPTSPLTLSIQQRVLPHLADAQQQINAAIAPYAVSLQAAKRRAEQLVAHSTVSDAVLEGQLAAGNLTGATVDPDVLLAYKLLKQPDFVNFSEAHGLRHEWLAASRLPGHPLIGESTVTRSKGMADMIDGSMQAMTGRMQPEMTTAWKAMDGQYKKVAQLYNSKYITEMSEKNLDDILTQTIRLDRPNDIKALREALGKTHGGGAMLDEVAQMWLTRRLQMATPGSTGKANIDELLGTLDTMTPQAQQALFPGFPINAVRDTLRQGKDMVDAVDLIQQGVKADPTAIAEVKGRLTPKRWQKVQSDVLAPMFTGGNEFDPVNPAHLVTQLTNLHNVKDIVFAPGHYESLLHLAHTQRAMQEMANQGQIHFSPAVRWMQRGGPLAGTGVGAGALYLFYTGHPVKAAIAGTVGATLPVISARGMAFLATNPRMVKLLTEGMTLPFSAKRSGEIAGQLIGTLYAHGLGDEVTEAPAPAAAVPAQESQVAPGGVTRQTD